MNNTAPCQGSNFTPIPTSLALWQSGPAFAVSSHQGREEAHPLQSQADLKKTRKHVPLISLQQLPPRKLEPTETFYRSRKKGKRKLDTWPLRSLTCTEVQAVKYRSTLEQHLEVAQEGAVLPQKCCNAVLSHASTWVYRAIGWTQLRMLYVLNWLLLLSPRFCHPVEHLRCRVLVIQCFCWSWPLKSYVFWVAWLKAVFPRNQIDASKLNVPEILQWYFQGLAKAYWNILEDIINLCLCQMNNEKSLLKRNTRQVAIISVMFNSMITIVITQCGNYNSYLLFK